MKIIDRVIFCLTNNENYLDFWNYISKIYRNKFDTIPTVFFSGTADEYQNLINTGILSNKHGEIYHLDIVSNISYAKELDWTCTWGLFYGASLFPDDVCMLSGIDQIPLSGKFFDLVKNYNTRENYIVGFSDAYGKLPSDLHSITESSWFPSSHHVGLGSFYKKLYCIKDTWEEELKRVFDSPERNKLSSSNY